MIWKVIWLWFIDHMKQDYLLIKIWKVCIQCNVCVVVSGTSLEELTVAASLHSLLCSHLQQCVSLDQALDTEAVSLCLSMLLPLAHIGLCLHQLCNSASLLAEWHYIMLMACLHLTFCLYSIMHMNFHEAWNLIQLSIWISMKNGILYYTIVSWMYSWFSL